MSETAFVTLIGSVLSLLGVVSTALSGVLVARISTLKRDVAAVKHEVKNDHDTNLRVEQDERHSENQKKLDYLVKAVEWLIAVAVNNRERIGDLEEHTGQPQAPSRRSLRIARAQAFITENDIPHTKE